MKCDRCNIEVEGAAKYCGQCGKPIDICPEPCAQELAAKHVMPEEVVESKPTPVLDVDFSHHAKEKDAVPHTNGAVPSTTMGSKRLVAIFSVILISLLTSAVIMYVRESKPSQLAQSDQAQTPIDQSASQNSSAPGTVVDNSPTRPAEEVQTRTATEETEEELAKKIAEATITLQKLVQQVDGKRSELDDRQRKLKKVNKQLADTQSMLKKLKSELVVAEGELKALRTEIASATTKLKKLNSDIVLARGTLRESRRVTAQLQRKKREVAILTRELTGLRQEASMRERAVRNLQRQIAGIKNADHASRNRRMPRKV